MGQNLAWFLYELRDTLNLFWYNGPTWLTMAGIALVAASWFSLRRT